MERVKELLALAPFVALTIAITYLQGYWGAFEILAFPYLSFQELLAYSAAPLFGFIFFALVGMVFRIINDIADRGKKRNRWMVRLENLIVIAFCAALIYFKQPEKWLFPPLVAMALALPPVLRSASLQSAREANPTLISTGVVMLFLLVSSFGYGRTQAERLIQAKEPSAIILFESGTEAVKLIGKLGAYYFIINAANHVAVIPEQSIRRIEYRN